MIYLSAQFNTNEKLFAFTRKILPMQNIASIATFHAFIKAQSSIPVTRTNKSRQPFLTQFLFLCNAMQKISKSFENKKSVKSTNWFLSAQSINQKKPVMKNYKKLAKKINKRCKKYRWWRAVQRRRKRLVSVDARHGEYRTLHIAFALPFLLLLLLQADWLQLSMLDTQVQSNIYDSADINAEKRWRRGRGRRRVRYG